MNGTDASLANQIRINACLNDTFQRRNPRGGFTTVTMPVNAPETLAEGEFNRFYIRGVCIRALSLHRDVIIYRAKAVDQPRPESAVRVGVTLNPLQVLEDLRGNVGVDTVLGVPGGPNSGLSVRMVTN